MDRATTVRQAYDKAYPFLKNRCFLKAKRAELLWTKFSYIMLLLGASVAVQAELRRAGVSETGAFSV